MRDEGRERRKDEGKGRTGGQIGKGSKVCTHSFRKQLVYKNIMSLSLPSFPYFPSLFFPPILPLPFCPPTSSSIPSPPSSRGCTFTLLLLCINIHGRALLPLFSLLLQDRGGTECEYQITHPVGTAGDNEWGVLGTASTPGHFTTDCSAIHNASSE